MKSIRIALLLFFIIQFVIATRYYDAILGKIRVWKGDDVSLRSMLQRNTSNPTTESSIIQNKLKLQQKCVPERNIVYIKTHKTASSTLHAIFQKYRRRIRIKSQAIHFPRYFIGGYPGHFRRNLTFYKNAESDVLHKLNPDQKPSEMLLSGHFRFHKDEILSFMPPNPKFITIMRSPFRQFESTYYNFYQHYEQYTNRSLRIPCLGQPVYQIMGRTQAPISEYLEKAKFALDDGSLPWFFRNRNFQSFDLGLDPLNKDEDYLRKSITELDSIMDLVLISDYFEESLVLLKHTLCMRWEDFYVPSRFVRDYERHSFTEKEKDVVRYLNNQDFVLFDHFNKTFWKKVDEFGRDNMERELKSLRSLLPKNSQQAQKQRTLSRRKRNEETSTHNNFIPIADRDRLFDQLLERIEVESKADGGGWPGREAALEVAKYMTNNHGLCSYY